MNNVDCTLKKEARKKEGEIDELHPLIRQRGRAAAFPVSEPVSVETWAEMERAGREQHLG